MEQETKPAALAADIRVVASGLAFPEGPAFAADGSLWAVELKAGNLVQYKNGELQRFPVGGQPNGIAISKEGNIWFCDAGRGQIRVYVPASGELNTVATRVDGEPLEKPNDLAFDAEGNLVFTCPGESRKEPTGYACALMKSGELKKITSGKYFPNGLAFAPGGKKLVLAETYKHRLWTGDWNAVTGDWTNEKIWCETGGPNGPGGPDGMAFDADGKIYVAVYGTGSIKIADSHGRLCNEIVLPGQNPTNCAFDPSGKHGLVVTEAEHGRLLSIQLASKGMNLF